jgi:hypothetical protein
MIYLRLQHLMRNLFGKFLRCTAWMIWCVSTVVSHFMIWDCFRDFAIFLAIS